MKLRQNNKHLEKKNKNMKYTKAVLILENWYLLKKSWTNDWLVMKPFVWFLDYENRTWKIQVPLGFRTDFGSIPQCFWWIYNPTRYLAYILHDFLYSKKYYWKLSRKEADVILYQALKVEWMWFLKRCIIYFAVRIFWRKFFRKN